MPGTRRDSCVLSSRPGDFKSFGELELSLQNLARDPLEESGGRVVHYRGNPAAKLMVVGEAPGAREDEVGLPFVGRSGKLLDEIFSAAGFDVEEEVYFTNIVKRRPPANRDPLPGELEYYKPWLLDEIRLLNPWIVVCTGRISMAWLLSIKQKISSVRGQWVTLPSGQWGMPIFHPSYLLRNPSRKAGSPKSLTWVDVQEIRRKYDECAAREQKQDEKGTPGR